MGNASINQIYDWVIRYINKEILEGLSKSKNQPRSTILNSSERGDDGGVQEEMRIFSCLVRTHRTRTVDWWVKSSVYGMRLNNLNLDICLSRLFSTFVQSISSCNLRDFFKVMNDALKVTRLWNQAWTWRFMSGSLWILSTTSNVRRLFGWCRESQRRLGLHDYSPICPSRSKSRHAIPNYYHRCKNSF